MLKLCLFRHDEGDYKQDRPYSRQVSVASDEDNQSSHWSGQDSRASDDVYRWLKTAI